MARVPETKHVLMSSLIILATLHVFQAHALSVARTKQKSNRKASSGLRACVLRGDGLKLDDAMEWTTKLLVPCTLIGLLPLGFVAWGFENLGCRDRACGYQLADTIGFESGSQQFRGYPKQQKDREPGTRIPTLPSPGTETEFKMHGARRLKAKEPTRIPAEAPKTSHANPNTTMLWLDQTVHRSSICLGQETAPRMQA